MTQSTAARIREAQSPLDLPHTCTPESCPPGDSYFISAVDGNHHFYMAGPYQTHAEALANVNRALEIARKHDGRAWFMSWGTCRNRRSNYGIRRSVEQTQTNLDHAEPNLSRQHSVNLGVDNTFKL